MFSFLIYLCYDVFMNKKLTILHTEASLGWGGQEKRIMRVMLGSLQAGHNVLLACNQKSKIYKEAKAVGIKVLHICHRSTIDPLAIFNYIKIIKKYSVDLVHTHSSRDAWNAGIAARLSMCKPIVIRTRHLAGKIANPFVYKYLADKVVTVGAYMARVFVDKYGLTKDKVLTIRTGIDLDFFNPNKSYRNLRDMWGCSQEDIIIIQVAVLRGKKGHKVLFNALRFLIDKGYSNVKVVVVGDGPMKDYLNDLIVELSLQSNVVMVGHRENIPEYLVNADIFCLPSFEEALGTSILEAMAMGLPAVASDVGGIPELIDSSRGGLFAVENDVECAKELEVLLDKSILDKKGTAAKKYAQSTASLHLMVEQTLNLYQSCISGC